MRWILTPLLWILAVGLVVVILWRKWRGKNVVLRGRWTPQVVRMAAILLVILGVGAEKAQPVPIPKPRESKDDREAQLPKRMTAEAIAAWINLQQQHGGWFVLKQQYEVLRLQGDEPTERAIKNVRALDRYLPAKLRAILKAEISALEKKQAAPIVEPATLLAALDELEGMGFYDHWLGAFLWRTATRSMDQADQKQTIVVFNRLHEHARLTNTLIKAYSIVKPINFAPQAWRSKSGRPMHLRITAKQVSAELLGAAKVIYKSGDVGTWDRDGLVLFKVAEGSAPLTLHHAGKELELREGLTRRFGRLDLLQTPKGDKPVALEHAWLGGIELPADRLISAWDLPTHLSKEAVTKLERFVSKAIDGDEKAAEQLEKMLPLAHRAIRIELKERPRAKGAARMRLILALFDDAVMPKLKAPTPLRLPLPIDATGRGRRVPRGR